MTIASEIAALRAMARRLNESWPAEESLRAARERRRNARTLPGVRFTATLQGAVHRGPSGNPAGRPRRGYRFRYADGRVEWRTDADPSRSTWDVLVQPDPSLRPGVLMFRRVVFAEHERPDIIEFHEDDPSARSRLATAALADLAAERRMVAPIERVEIRGAVDDCRSKSQRRAFIQSQPQNGMESAHARSWMPSISGVGPIVLRWPASEERPEVEEWMTYEHIRRTCSWAPNGGPLWFVGPGARHEEARAAVDAAVPHAAPRGTEAGLDAFARAIAARLAPRPRTLPAVTKHLGALPRDRAARLTRSAQRRAARDGRRTWFSIDAPGRRSMRTTLGTLAARYAPRCPDGSYNRHDARRWMRAFARVVAAASDALQEHNRLRAVEVLCECVGLEDAWVLTERPADARPDWWGNAPMFSASADRRDGWVSLLDGPAMTRPAPPWASATPEEILEDIAALAERGFASQYNQRLVPTRDEMYPVLTSTGADLDAVAAQVGLRRHQRSQHGVHPETDADLRRRVEAALFGQSAEHDAAPAAFGVAPDPAAIERTAATIRTAARNAGVSLREAVRDLRRIALDGGTPVARAALDQLDAELDEQDRQRRQALRASNRSASAVSALIGRPLPPPRCASCNGWHHGSCGSSQRLP